MAGPWTGGLMWICLSRGRQAAAGPGTNPEELFAVSYAACFQSALLPVATGRRLDASGSQVTFRAGIGPTGHGGLGLTVPLTCTRLA